MLNVLQMLASMHIMSKLAEGEVKSLINIVVRMLLTIAYSHTRLK